MSEDLTRKLSGNDKDAILTAIKNLETVVRSSFDNLVTWVSSIDSRFKHLERKVEERLYDTPMWHKVVADVNQLQAGLDSARSEVHQLSNKMDDLSREQAREFHAVDERIRRLEVN